MITATKNCRPEGDEYTPSQRRLIDTQLDAAEKGPFHGPFENGAKMIASVKGTLKKPAAIKKSKRIQ